MKRKPWSLWLIFLPFCLALGQSQAQMVTGVKQEIEIAIDDLGNGQLTLKMKLNASQWDMFKRIAGSNPSILKRAIIRSMPSVYFTDFKYEEDQMERIMRFSMKAFGVMKVNDRGIWSTDLGLKDPNIIKVNDHEYHLNSNYMNNGALFEQSQTILLPANARNSKIKKDSYDKAMLTYETKTSIFRFAPEALGLLLILTGVILSAIRLLHSPSPSTPPTISSPPPPLPGAT